MRVFSYLSTSTTRGSWAQCLERVAFLLLLRDISAGSLPNGGWVRSSMSTCNASASFSSLSAASSATSTPNSTSYAHHTYRPRRDLYTPPPAHLSLKQVVIIARHGDRAPIARNVGQAVQDSPSSQELWQSKLPSLQELQQWSATYPLSDPSLKPVDQHEHPYAQLTRRGAEELRALGKHLRERYVCHLKWLPAQLHSAATATTGGESENLDVFTSSGSSSSDFATKPRLIYARATNIRRTQQSCQNLLLGLYPPPSSPSSVPPLTIDVRPTHLETLYPNADRSCCRQGEIIAELRQQHYRLPPSLVRSITEEAHVRLGLTPSLTSATPALVPWNQVREVWTCHAVHGLPFPSSVEGGGVEGGEEEWFERVEQFTCRMWGSWFREEEMTRLAIGPFLKEVLEGIEGKASGRKGQREGMGEGGKVEHVVVYAGHDSSIVPVLAALGIWEDVWPPYAANIVLELAEKEGGREGGRVGEHFVRILYNDEERVLFGEEGEGWREGGEVWYPLEVFSEKIKRFLPTDYEKECRCRNDEEGKDGGEEDEVASSIK